MNKYKLSLLTITVLIASGCGSNNSNTNTQITKPPKKAIISKTSRGYYTYNGVPIEGVKFECGNISGYTYTQGEFTYEIGSDCTFRLNQITLKKIKASELTKDVQINEESQDNLRLLLSLDNDGNADHIKITKAVRDALGEINHIPSDEQMKTLVKNIKLSVNNFEGDAKSKADILGLSDLKLYIKKSGSTLYGEKLTLEAKLNSNKDSIEEVQWSDNDNILPQTSIKIQDNSFTSGKHTIIAKAITKKGLDLNTHYEFEIIPIDFTLEIKPPQNSTYDINERVEIKPIIKGDIDSIISYRWKDKNNEIDNEQNLSQTFSIGEHDITLSILTNEKEFTKKTSFTVSDWSNFSEKENIFTDHTTNLEWISETQTTQNNACLAIHTKETYEKAKSFCENLDFSGGNWRIPTSDELKTLITSTIRANVLPGYLAPCPVLLAYDAQSDDNSTYIDGGYTSVITRFGETQDEKAGETKKLDIQDSGMSIGLRCVR